MSEWTVTRVEHLDWVDRPLGLDNWVWGYFEKFAKRAWDLLWLNRDTPLPSTREEQADLNSTHWISALTKAKMDEFSRKREIIQTSLRNYPEFLLELEKSIIDFMNTIELSTPWEVYSSGMSQIDEDTYEVRNGSLQAPELAKSLRIIIEDIIPKIHDVNSASDIENTINWYKTKHNYRTWATDLNKGLLEIAFLYVAKIFSHYYQGEEQNKESIILWTLLKKSRWITPDSYKRVYD